MENESGAILCTYTKMPVSISTIILSFQGPPPQKISQGWILVAWVTRCPLTASADTEGKQVEQRHVLLQGTPPSWASDTRQCCAPWAVGSAGVMLAPCTLHPTRSSESQHPPAEQPRSSSPTAGAGPLARCTQAVA